MQQQDTVESTPREKFRTAFQLLMFLGIYLGGSVAFTKTLPPSSQFPTEIHGVRLPLSPPFQREILVDLGQLAFFILSIMVVRYILVRKALPMQVLQGFNGPHRLRDVLAGFLVGLLLMSIRLLPLVKPIEGSALLPQLSLHLSASPWLLILGITMFFSSIEELAFRGYLFPVCATTFGPRRAYVLITVAFGLAHVVDGSSGDFFSAMLVTLIVIFRASFLYTATYWFTRRIWLSIGLHTGADFLGIFVIGLKSWGVTGLLPVNRQGDRLFQFFNICLTCIVTFTVAYFVSRMAQRRDEQEPGYWNTQPSREPLQEAQ